MADKLWLDRRHPAYNEKAPHWVFCRQSYEGGPAYFRDNLVRHSKEDDEDFKERLERACRYNFTAQSVGLVSGHLLKTPPARKTDDVSEAVRRFWQKATKDGDDIDTFAREMADWSSVYGRLYVVVDVPSDDGIAPQSELERQARGLEPYVYTVAPDDALNFATDGKGEFLWMLFREPYREDRDPFTVSEDVGVRYRLWERGKWSLWEKRKDDKGQEHAAKVDEGLVPFDDRIPVVAVEHKDGDEFTSPGLVDDLVYIDKSVFNLLSELDETIVQQTFGQLTIPSDALDPNDSLTGQMLVMGKKRIFLYNSEAKTRPGFIAPDASQGGLILQTIENRCQMAHDSVNLGDEVGGGTRQQQDVSGVARAYDFAKLESGLATKAGEQEEAEYKIACLADLWTGGDGKLDKSVVSYSRKFDVIALQQALQDALSVEAVLGGASPTAVAEMRKQVAAKALENAEPDVLEKINQEINQAASVEMMEPAEEEEMDDAQDASGVQGQGVA